MPKKKNILVCPLDWGLGHATRMVPVIEKLIEKGANVIAGADNRPLAFLQQRFPDLRFVKLPGFIPTYPDDKSMTLTMLRSYPEMLSEAKKAKQLLQKLIADLEIDIVISDNRYELSSQDAYCVFITHQLNIQTPGISTIAKPFITKKINNYIKTFDELWIPDFEEEHNLSGVLSHINKFPLANHHFVGLLSRFSQVKQVKDAEKTDILIVLSGPEPQRSNLEKLLLNQALKTEYETIILQGKPESLETVRTHNVKIIPHLPDDEFAALIKQSKIVICRPGYSTIMDLAVLEKKAIFIPTPGQTEQEYLAEKYKKQGLFYSEKQKHFDLQKAIEAQENYSGVGFKPNSEKLNERINSLLGANNKNSGYH